LIIKINQILILINLFFLCVNLESTNKTRKYLEGLDDVKFNEIQVADQLKKQLEYFDRDVNTIFLLNRIFIYN